MIRTLLSTATATLIATASAFADYPDRPITVVIAFNPGGANDISVRTWAPYMEKCLGGATLVPINRPGAGGQIGWTEIANAEPDGYTIGALSSPHVELSTITKQPRYTLDSFDFLGSFTASVITVNVARNGKYKTLDDLIAAAKKADGQLSVAVGQIGGDDHLLLRRMEEMAGVKFRYIPMDGEAPVRTALLGGNVEAAGFSEGAVAQFQDELLSLAVASEQRVETLPDTPTFRELGYDLLGGSNHLIGAPAGMPKEAHDKLASCIETIAVDPAFKADITARKMGLHPMNAAQTTDFVNSTYKIYSEMWKQSPWMQ